MEALLKKLQEYGADTKGAMERFLDDTELYEMCLVTFMKDEGFAGLEKALAEKAYDKAFDHAHTLKGVAGNLGLTPLFQAISDIVEPLRRK